MLVKDIHPTCINGTTISIEVLNIRHIRPHRHCDAIEFIYCFKGNLRTTLAHKKDLAISAGELVLVDHDDIHYISADEDNCTLIMHIDTECFYSMFDDINCVFLSCATRLCRPYQKEALNQIIGNLLTITYLYHSNMENIHHNDPCNKIKNLTSRLIEILLKQFRWCSVEGLDSDENEKYNNRLDNIIAYIQNNYFEKITIVKVAEQVYMAPNYLSQFLKRTYFSSFTKMVNYIRAYEAEKLLLFTNKPIHEISDLCGFSSVKYLHKHFKAFWGTTPLQHRIAYRNLMNVPEEVFEFAQEDVLEIIKEEMVKHYVGHELEMAEKEY